MHLTDKIQKKKAPGARYRVLEDQTVGDFLQHAMNGRSLTSIKQLLKKDAIRVGRRVVKRLDEMVHAGEFVFVGSRPEPEFPMPPGLRIIWEDRYLIVVRKESGLLTVANVEEQVKTAESYLNAYMEFRQEGKRRVYVVHRIDRDTSGILIFAKDEQTQQALRTDWNEMVLSRQYVAVVEGHPRYPEGRIDTWVNEDKSMTMYISRHGEGKRAITEYEVIKENDDFSLLALELETGRKNQIRVHMQYIGTPIAGDPKYGAQTDPIGRLCLHARQIKFLHPVTGEQMEFESDIPKDFLKIFK